ncbi:2-amino-4-hydroxy-6-hydroxymethyldihydropteridine diphosphokinase [Acetobacter tropicalis]|uniref:2-amino-4-hydroxy-6-hydroxymethyldihydropteridine pyrophosphokinase n=2 Tax=Acetobacter tropicalis TaxID=104102 RepID=A0A252A7Y7_9PROT|nr:2-amino-4-hydroxy-6-hydroxymethyldihydropteridine diphosphokinase [Acetobacter tropicalis]MDO8172706.1 2-amino-4-hydroxy-6-hydroxymethyldihydropteridine diphosphokinase [Acetobacter tropicalis]OUI85661.1 2-amino-4-hydroxy-6-hydroxymethyldihydropteridine pyrophosphokinase [Acetobacter tropicalis]
MKFWKGAEMVLIAVGANLPLGGQAALETCRKVVETLRALPGLHVVAVSHWYESAPVPPSGQPPYVNGVVRATTTLTPDALLAALQQIELDFGRERSVRNAARTLDLDIIAFGALCQDVSHLILPHPRAHERAFVLLPLRDVMPEWVHPATGQMLEALLERVCGQEIRQIQE